MFRPLWRTRIGLLFANPVLTASRRVRANITSTDTHTRSAGWRVHHQFQLCCAQTARFLSTSSSRGCGQPPRCCHSSSRPVAPAVALAVAVAVAVTLALADELPAVLRKKSATRKRSAGSGSWNKKEWRRDPAADDRWAGFSCTSPWHVDTAQGEGREGKGSVPANQTREFTSR